MTGYVVDASVAVKWLVAEEFSDAAACLLKAGATIATPAPIFAGDAYTIRAVRRRTDGPKTTGLGHK